ncbi:MAG: hypothetical protein IH962_00735, partial [Chloroflexi bacterium]|nr:hypothetical protein [Chloroflexota bacterium]
LSADPRSNDERHLMPDPAMYQTAIEAAGQAGLPVAHLDSLTVDQVITKPTAKSALRDLYPGGIVDMEDYPIALVARESGIPFLSARIVLDVAEQGLPAYLPRMARSRTRAVASAAAMPWRIPAMWRLARQMATAQRVLTRFALSYIQTLRERERSLGGPGAVEAAAGLALTSTVAE